MEDWGALLWIICLCAVPMVEPFDVNARREPENQF